MQTHPGQVARKCCSYTDTFILLVDAFIHINLKQSREHENATKESKLKTKVWMLLIDIKVHLRVYQYAFLSNQINAIQYWSAPDCISCLPLYKCLVKYCKESTDLSIWKSADSNSHLKTSFESFGSFSCVGGRAVDFNTVHFSF